MTVVFSSIQVNFLVSFKSCLYLLLFLCLLPHFLNINNMLLLLNLFDRLDCLLLVCVSFSIDQILVDLYLPLIKISIIIDSQLRSNQGIMSWGRSNVYNRRTDRYMKDRSRVAPLEFVVETCCLTMCCLMAMGV